MNREIKFKAWLPHSKKMTYPHSIEELIEWDIKGHHLGTGTWLQFTGVYSRDRKEIYEGDIVTYESSGTINSERSSGLVKYHDGAFVVGIEMDLLHLVYPSVIIIGNIYERPDLFHQSIT